MPSSDLTEEGEEEELLDVPMANLNLGPLCPCSDPSANSKCRNNRKEKNSSDKYPDFWRRTRSNKILEHKMKNNKKKLSYEILKPSKLQFIQGVDKDSSDFDEPEPDSADTASPSSESLPDFTTLKIRSQTELAITSAKNSVDLSRLSTLQFVKKPPRWKNRASKSKAPSLPTIPEDESEGPSVIGSLDSLSISAGASGGNVTQSCSQQALTESNNNGQCDDITIDELASYLDLLVHIPKKMSPMAEMMYT